MILLEKREPEKNLDRVYLLDVCSTIIGQHCIIRAYGRRGSYIRFLAPLEYSTREEANQARNKLLKARRKRGYTPKLIA